MLAATLRDLGKIKETVETGRFNAFLCLLAQYGRWHMIQALAPPLREEKELVGIAHGPPVPHRRLSH